MTTLGEFLRARRELVRPEVAGLPGGTARRVGGLRREEAAIRAGISSDYNLRLEHRPRPQPVGTGAARAGRRAAAGCRRDRAPAEPVVPAIAAAKRSMPGARRC
ncbi:hypothetical protein AB0F91_08460 [Amycolatopsis sp. NPDC023774]|uniref:hypothetical protein n=1 Tax=Amycolatopsis sp. NPDC023774 TaxID=3155015 RepID=UPI0033C17BE8